MKNKYKITFIPWWEHKWYKEGISFVGWIKHVQKASLTGYMVCMFNDELSNLPELHSVLSIEKEIRGSDLSTMNKRQQAKYLKGIEMAMFDEVKRYKIDLEKTGYWITKYKLTGFSKTQL